MSSESKSTMNTEKSGNPKKGTKNTKKTRKDDIKRLLKSELKREMKPLFIGSLAMLCSTASNQGTSMYYLYYG